MQIFRCRLCNEKTEMVFSSKIMNKYNIKYYRCKNCGLLQTEDPYWLEESYRNAINVSDTGILSRNIRLSKKTTLIISFFFNEKAKFLDYAGGYGIFTRLMRDIGFDYYWYDPYSQNLVAREFEFPVNSKIELLTCFECFEHLITPLEDVKKMLGISKNILFSTSLLPVPLPKPEEWWYYGREHGQHISFYSKKTLEYIASIFNLNLYSYGDLHLLTQKRIFPGIFEMSVKFSIPLYYLSGKPFKEGLTSSDMEYVIKKTETHL